MPSCKLDARRGAVPMALMMVPMMSLIISMLEQVEPSVEMLT